MDSHEWVDLFCWRKTCSSYARCNQIITSLMFHTLCKSVRAFYLIDNSVVEAERNSLAKQYFTYGIRKLQSYFL